MTPIILLCQGPGLLLLEKRREELRDLNVTFAGLTRAWIPQNRILTPIGRKIDLYWYSSKSLWDQEIELENFIEETLPEIFMTASCYQFHRHVLRRYRDLIRIAPEAFEPDGHYQGRVLCVFAFLATLIENEGYSGREFYLVGLDLGAGKLEDLEDKELRDGKAEDYQEVLRELAREMNEDRWGINRVFAGQKIWVVGESTLEIFPKISLSEMFKRLKRGGVQNG